MVWVNDGQSQSDISGKLIRNVRGRSKTGAIIPESGIYRVAHSAHRLPHEVTLLKGETFPKCQKCADAVTFESGEGTELQDHREGVALARTLCELPVIDDPAPARAG
jgi:hypothetical protein